MEGSFFKTLRSRFYYPGGGDCLPVHVCNVAGHTRVLKDAKYLLKPSLHDWGKYDVMNLGNTQTPCSFIKLH